MSAFIDAQRERLGVEPICRELEVSASAYRARRRRPASRRARRDAWLLEQIRRVHAESGGVYGQFKVWDELNDTGTPVARCTIERLMRRYGIVGTGPAKTRQTTLPGEKPVAPPTWCGVTSRRAGRTSSGWPTSPMSAPGRAGATWPWS